MIATNGTCCMRIYFDVGDTNHKPLKIRFIYQYFQQAFPFTIIKPTAISVVDIFQFP